MRDDGTQDANPYASPGGDVDDRIYATRTPADVLDILTGIAEVAVVFAYLFSVPVALVFAVDRLLTLGQYATLAVGIVASLPSVLWFLKLILPVVKSVSVDEDGLHFQCSFGTSIDWSWHTILAIQPASRREVVNWREWIRQLIGPRERAICASTRGHYRIQGKTDYCFFPPKNPEAFVEAIARYRPDLLTEQE